MSLRASLGPPHFLSNLENPNHSYDSNDHHIDLPTHTSAHKTKTHSFERLIPKFPHLHPKPSPPFFSPISWLTQPWMKPLEWASIPEQWAFPLPPPHCQPAIEAYQFYLPNTSPCTAMVLVQVTTILFPAHHKRFLIVSLSPALIKTLTLNTPIVLITLRKNSKLFNLAYKTFYDLALLTPRLISL